MRYRQAKQLWKRYQEEGAAGLKHRSAERLSNRACAEMLRRKVLERGREKYGGPVGERFGPTLAAVVRYKVYKGVKKERAAENS